MGQLDQWNSSAQIGCDMCMQGGLIGQIGSMELIGPIGCDMCMQGALTCSMKAATLKHRLPRSSCSIHGVYLRMQVLVTARVLGGDRLGLWSGDRLGLWRERAAFLHGVYVRGGSVDRSESTCE